MASEPDSNRELQRQRAGVEAAFLGELALPDVGQPGVLLVPEFREARRVIRLGGPTWLDQDTIRAVRDGAKPGDSLPPAQRDGYTEHVTDVEVIITGSGEGRRVAVLFSHRQFPGVRFGHRFELDPSGGYGPALAFREGIETGALNPMMDMGVSADNDGISWTPWSARVPGLEQLEQQFAEIGTAFREGWRPVRVGEPRVLTERAYVEVRKILGRGGWTGLDLATVEAVRAGSRPGDPLPPLQPSPYIDDVTDTEVTITGSGEGGVWRSCSLTSTFLVFASVTGFRWTVRVAAIPYA